MISIHLIPRSAVFEQDRDRDRDREPRNREPENRDKKVSQGPRFRGYGRGHGLVQTPRSGVWSTLTDCGSETPLPHWGPPRRRSLSQRFCN